MGGRTLAFSSVFFCMFGNHLCGHFYRNMIVELTFQVWIPIKNQEVTKPNIETAIFLRGLGKKILYLRAVMQYYAQKQTSFPNINETEK